MHNPGVCGIILAAVARPTAAALDALIDALTTDTEMVLVALDAGDHSLEPVAWARAAYAVPMAAQATESDILRRMLQEVLNYGRDTALLVSAAQPTPSAADLRAMIAAYSTAADEIWAVVADSAAPASAPILLGRNMIEQCLRQQGWRTTEELLAANRAHVLAPGGGAVAAERPQ
jgi:hypothetical protein